MKIDKHSIVFATPVWFCAISLGAQPADEYTLQFQASSNGLSAIARRSLERNADQTYRLTNNLEASIGGQVISSLEQISVMAIGANGLIPSSYSYQQEGLNRETKTVNYNWHTMEAISTEASESWQINLGEPTYDQLSHQFALRQALIANINELEFPVIDDDKIEILHYQILGRETISTPLGNFNSTKVTRIRSSDDDRATIFWLADDWQFLLIRMEQTNSGLTTVLELKKGLIAGEELKPLD